MKTTFITPKQYADKKGCAVQYIHRLVAAEALKKLPGVKNINKYGRFYTLEVPANFLKSK